MSAPAERILDELGDPIARDVVRALAAGSATQSDLIKQLNEVCDEQVSQSKVSRTASQLKACGLVDAGRSRGELRLRARDESLALLQAANNLAEALANLDAAQQADLSKSTRRELMRPAPSARTEDG